MALSRMAMDGLMARTYLAALSLDGAPVSEPQPLVWQRAAGAQSSAKVRFGPFPTRVDADGVAVIVDGEVEHVFPFEERGTFPPGTVIEPTVHIRTIDRGELTSG